MRASISVAVVVMLLALLPACAGEPVEESLAAGNRLENPSFEAGRDPWFSFDAPVWADFSITDATARSGRHSAVLELQSAGYTGDHRVYGVVQDLSVDAFPRRVGGWYRVENWTRGAEKQYVQVVVSVTGATNLQRTNAPSQIAYVLVGLTERPFSMVNRAFEFAGRREPREGEWIRFDLDLHEAGRRAWGTVPVGFERLRVFFEVRFDERDPSSPEPASADVYYDDLYLGD